MPKLQKRVSTKEVIDKKSKKKVTYKSESYNVTLEKDYIDMLGWKEGDKLIETLTQDKKGIIIERP